MRDIKYDVSQLFKIAFGINSPIFITSTLQKKPPENISFKGIELIPDFSKSEKGYNDISATSWMGTPIIFSAWFNGGCYKQYKRNGEIENITMHEFHLPPATLFSFRRAKNIVRTNVLGSNGTVKEIYGFDDWIIDVKGLCLDEPERSAKEQIDNLLKWEKIADSIGINGVLFNQLDIKAVCISDWSHNIPQGTPGVIPFQFQMYGDEDILFKL